MVWREEVVRREKVDVCVNAVDVKFYGKLNNEI